MNKRAHCWSFSHHVVYAISVSQSQVDYSRLDYHSAPLPNSEAPTTPPQSLVCRTNQKTLIFFLSSLLSNRLFGTHAYILRHRSLQLVITVLYYCYGGIPNGAEETLKNYIFQKILIFLQDICFAFCWVENRNVKN